jgi:pseudaminic acid cytidylyltransferase
MPAGRGVRIAVIPARGGSKRIPRKNIRPFAGRPIIAYSIDAARASGLFERIVVSTDDEEIAEVARRAGAEVPFMRPKELADDRTGTNAVVKHALAWFAGRGERFDPACCIYATAPLVTAHALREGLDKLEASGRSFAIAVTSYPFPIQRAVKIDRDGAIQAFAPEHVFTRSQDLEPAYHDAAQFYWGRAQAFLDDVVGLSPASVPVLLPRHRVQDIDTQEDWTRAEIAYEILRRTGELD